MIELKLDKKIGDAAFQSLIQFNSFASLERYFKAKTYHYTMVDNPMGMKYRIKASAANMSKILKVKNILKLELYIEKSPLSVSIKTGTVSIS